MPRPHRRADRRLRVVDGPRWPDVRSSERRVQGGVPTELLAGEREAVAPLRAVGVPDVRRAGYRLVADRISYVDGLQAISIDFEGKHKARH